MRVRATLISVLVLAGCGDDETRTAAAAPSRPAGAADLAGAWTATFGTIPVELAFVAAGSPDTGLELTLVQNGEGWGLGRLRVDAAQGTVTLDREKRCGRFEASVAGDRLAFTSADTSCASSYFVEMLTAKVWRRRPPVPEALAGTWRATIAGERASSAWTLEFNATGGIRNGPSMVLDGDTYGTAVHPVSVWVTGPRSGGLRLRGAGARGCREFAYVAEENRLTLAATGTRCPHAHLDEVLSRGFWERPR